MALEEVEEAIKPVEHEPAPLSELEKAYSGGDPSEKPVFVPEPDEKIDDEAKPVEEGGEATPAAGEGEDIDETLLEQAKALGFTDDEIQSFGSNAVLQKVVDRSTPREVKPAEVVKPAEAAKAEPDFKIDLDDKEYDPKVVKTLNDMNAHYAKKHAELEANFKKQLSEGLAPVQEYRQQQFNLAVDSVFDALGVENPEMKPLLGSGSVDSLIGKAEHGTRVAIVRQATVLEAGHLAAGQKAPPLKTLISQAAQIVLGSKLKTLATNKVRSAVSERRSQFVARGTPNRLSGDSGKSPEDRARAAVAAKLKSLGE